MTDFVKALFVPPSMKCIHKIVISCLFGLDSIAFLPPSITKTILNLSLYSLYYAEACNELAGPISASLHPGNTAPSEEMSQRWRANGNAVSDLTEPRFEPQISRSRDERVTSRPTDLYHNNIIFVLWLTTMFIF